MAERVKEVAKGVDKGLWKEAWWSEEGMGSQRKNWRFCSKDREGRH
jgi:hypothetical protein